MKITTSKPLMMRLMSTTLIGGLVPSGTIQSDGSSIFILNKTLPSIMAWGEFKNSEIKVMGIAPVTITDTILKNTKSIHSSDITLEKTNGSVLIEGSTANYSEQETISPQGDKEGDKIARPELSTDIDAAEFDVEVSELKKLPTADKYTFDLGGVGAGDQNILKVIVEDIGKLEIKLDMQNTKKRHFFGKKSFSGDMVEKIISQLGGDFATIKITDKWISFSSTDQYADVQFILASLVDTGDVIV